MNASRRWRSRAESRRARLPNAGGWTARPASSFASFFKLFEFFEFLGLFLLCGLLAGGGCSTLFPSSPDPNVSTKTWDVYGIQLNSVGFLPGRVKLATVVAPGGTTFDLHDVSAGMTDSVVWSAPLTGPVQDPETGAELWIADFTAFTDPGTYYLSVEGTAARSASFAIDPDVYQGALATAVMGLTGARCGTAVSLTMPSSTSGTDNFTHKACHTHDAYLDVISGQDTIQPSLHGWHDAGDYGKYTTNAAFAVGMLLEAWDHFQPTLGALQMMIPEHGGAIPDYLAEVKWELDWLLTMQFPGGGVAFKVTAYNFEAFLMPEDDGSPRYFAPVGSGATADFAAVMAMAARIYAGYDPAFAASCKAAAQLASAYLTANPGNVIPDQSKFTTGTYDDADDSDERLWAAAELFETTGDATSLKYFEDNTATPAIDEGFDWPHVSNLGYFTYALSQQPGRNPDRVAAIDAALLAAGDDIAATAGSHLYGRGIGSSYYWGSAGVVVRNSMNLWVAGLLAPPADPTQPAAPDPKAKYLDAMARQLDYVLGRNPFGRSWVTALGYHPPLFPHHRPSASDNVADPWPGLLIGGPQHPGTTYLDSGGKSQPSWEDVRDDYNVNEVAINWTAAFIYATAAFVH